MLDYWKTFKGLLSCTVSRKAECSECTVVNVPLENFLKFLSLTINTARYQKCKKVTFSFSVLLPEQAIKMVKYQTDLKIKHLRKIPVGISMKKSL